MRRLALAPFVCFLAFAAIGAACGSGSISGTAPDGGGNCNGAICDAPIKFDAFPLGCADPGGTPCKIGEICYKDRCYTDTCVAQGDAGAACPAGQVCSPQCVRTQDACEGKVCGANQTCQNGQCVDGCFSPSACIGKTCAAGEFCQNGTCQTINPCDLPCPTGQVCNAFCHLAGPCEGVTCAADEVCIGSTAPDGGMTGTCVKNLCFGVTCEPTQICSNGACLDTCAGACPCTPPAICVQNKCVNECVPDCNPAHDKHCGSDDGCGGKCRIQDCGTGMTCNADDMCVCDPSCSGKQCGELNACGDHCNVPCGGNETCDPNQGCVCGTALCGTACCGSGQTCVAGACCSAAATCDPGSPTLCCDSGQTCEPHNGKNELCCKASSYCPTAQTCCDTATDPVCNVSGTHEKCCPQGNSLCTADDSCCPKGDQCFKATPASTTTSVCCSNSTNYCANTGECCDAQGTGFTCDSDETHCCAPGKTGGYCPKLEGGAACCSASEKCRDEANGTDQLCCTDKRWCKQKKICCTTDDTGRVLTDPMCFNNDNATPDDDLCCNSNEKIFQGHCCTPSCPAGGTCGQSDGCGGTCTGRCIEPGQTCTLVNGTYQCKVNECNPVCDCGEYCVNGTCQPLCPPDQSLCGCSGCCSPSAIQYCNPSTGMCPIP